MDLATLNSSLDQFLIPNPAYPSNIWDYFNNLSNLGCRPTELHRIELWSVGPASQFILQPTKNNYNRYFYDYELSPTLRDAIINGVNPYYGILYGKSLYYFNKWYLYQPCKIGTKNIDTYLFRHRYIKNLAHNGFTVPEITAKLGWVNPDMALNYINSVIEYTP